MLAARLSRHTGAKGLCSSSHCVPQRYQTPYGFVLVAYTPLASLFSQGKNGPIDDLPGLLVLFLTHINCRHGSLEVTLSISLSTAPPALTQPLPVSQPAAAAVALAETAAAVVFPLALAATVALAAPPPLAEPAPRHATTTHATAATATRRRARQ